MAAQNIKGPGMLYVTSKISRKDIMSEETYFKWYDEDHIDEIVNTDGIKSAYRYIDTNPKADKPFLAFYPMPDIGFTQGERFRKIRVKSSILPGTGICYDLADIDVRYLGLMDKSGSRKGVAECLVTIGIEPGPTSIDSEVEKWYKSDQQDAVSKIPGYIRTTIYKLLYARTNAQSRALKGLPTTDERSPEPPTWQAIHEFDRVVPHEELKSVQKTEAAGKILSSAKQVEVCVYKLAKAFGEKGFFD